MSSPRLSRRLAGCATAAALALAACSGGGSTADTQPEVSVSTSSPGRVDDGVFVLGVVSPDTGPGVDIGQSVEAGVALAVQEINAGGGVIGEQVRVLQRDEGDNRAMALRGVQDLVQLGADAIIGPTSSNDLLGSLSVAVDGGVLTCSPTATALALDRYPDRGLLVRTVPSDSLQAQAIARLVDDSGSSSTAVVYLDDPFGRPLADAVQGALTTLGIAVSGAIGFTSAEDRITAAVDRIAALHPSLVVVLGDDTTGPLIIDEIEQLDLSPRPNYIVNDAVRRPSVSAPPIAGDVASRVQGVAPLSSSGDPSFLERLHTIDDTVSDLYAHDAYDCVNLIALAVAASGSTDPGNVASAIPAVSAGGTSCATFPECAAELDAGRNIDYEGPSGNLAIGVDGDPDVAVFERFGFDPNGKDVTLGRLTVG